MDSSYNYSYSYNTGGGISPVVLIIYFLAIAVLIVSLWKIFTKAGKPGWASIVPIYNIYVLLQIVGRPGWWLLLYLVPFVNIVVAIIVALDLAKAFGKSTMFGVFGLIIFSIVGYPMLAFGDAKYVKPGGAAPTTPSTPTKAAV